MPQKRSTYDELYGQLRKNNTPPKNRPGPTQTKTTTRPGPAAEEAVSQPVQASPVYDLPDDGLYFTADGLSMLTNTPAQQAEAVSAAVPQAEAAQPEPSNLEKILQSLMAQYDSTNVYTPRTEAERRAQAEGEYQTHYDSLRQTARQQQEQNDLALQQQLENDLITLQQQGDRSDLALQQQRAGLQDTYDRQREDSARQYRQAYSQADRQMLGRGMQRSSYAAQTLANIGQKGAEAQQRLWDAQGAAEGNIDTQRAQLAAQIAEQRANASRQSDAKRAQLAQQLNAQLAQYDNSQNTDIMNRMRQLEDQDYTRTQESQSTKNQLAANIYNLLVNAEKNGISTGSGSSSAASGYGGAAAAGGSASGYAGGGSSGSGGGSSGSRGSAGNPSFSQSDYTKSIAAIKAGKLKANESPITTLGGIAAANAFYKTNPSASTVKNAGSGAQVSGAAKSADLSTTAGLINALTPKFQPVASIPSSSTVQLSGPVDNSFLGALNQMGASENKTFESELQKALASKKK